MNEDYPTGQVNMSEGARRMMNRRAMRHNELSDEELAMFIPDDIDNYKYRRAEELRREYHVNDGKIGE